MGVKRDCSEETAAVRSVIESWATAVRCRDMERILRHHSSDIVMFDVPPPFQSRGIDDYEKTWDLFFAYAPTPAVFDIIDLEIATGPDVAFAFATMHCTGGKENDPLDFRLTIGLRKIDGQWTITHEHHSIPAAD